jgi:predicted Rossmann-fold nucleotide-binding protein
MKIEAVTFFGHSEAKPEGEEFQAAKKSAFLLARKGITIVNGAGPGIMKASTLGAKEAGGKSIGVGFTGEGMTNFEGRDPDNPVDEEITAEDYWQRTKKLLELGDVYVIFNGGTGTVSEFGMAWGLARLFFGKHKPMLLYGSWWHDIMEAFGKNMKIRQEELQVYEIVSTPEEVLNKIEELTKN